MTPIADTGYVVAVAIDTDRKHAASLAVHRTQQTILLPQSVLAEVAFMLTRQVAKERLFNSSEDCRNRNIARVR